MQPSTTFTAAILDHQPVDATGLKSFLRSTEFQPKFWARSYSEFIEQMSCSTGVDLVICEVELPDAPELPLHLPKNLDSARLVYFSSRIDPILMSKVYQGQSAGFLDKQSTRDFVLQSLRRVMSEGNCWTRLQSRQLAGALSVPRVSMGDRASVTRKEFEILQWIAAGKTNQEISERVGASYETVKEHVQNLLRRLELSDRTQAAIWMVRHELDNLISGA